MAKNPHPYSCDECGISKKPSNGWFLLANHGVTVSILKWDDADADTEGIKHLCGIPCALKAAGKELEKIYGKTE